MDKNAAIISSPITLLYVVSFVLLSTHPTGPILEISKNLKTKNVSMKSSSIGERDSIRLPVTVQKSL
jgi:hypothetical protein